MHDTNLLEDQPIAWTPTPDVIERAQLTKFMRQVGVSTWDELYEFSIRDVEKFTEEVLKFLDIKFDPPYEKLLDTSEGVEFPKWFLSEPPASTGGEESAAESCSGSTSNSSAKSLPPAHAGGSDRAAPSHAGLNITEMCLDRWQAKEIAIRESQMELDEAGENDASDALDSSIVTALIWEDEDGREVSLTYLELSNKVDHCASGLLEHGLRAGDAVGIHLPMSAETVVALLAINRIGAIAVPVFSGYGIEAIVSRMKAVNAKAIFTCKGFNRRGKFFNAREVSTEVVDQCPTIEKVFVVEEFGKDFRTEFIECATALIADSLEREEMFGKSDRRARKYVSSDSLMRSSIYAYPQTAQTSAEDPLIILYTSGTTGKPKGIAHTHASFPIKAAQDMAFGTDVGRSTRICWYTDIGWMMGPWLIYGALINGATICIYDGAPDYPTPDRMWEFCAKHKVEVLGISPTLVRALAAKESEPPASAGGDASTAESTAVPISGSSAKTTPPADAGGSDIPPPHLRHDLSSLRIFASTGEPWNPAPWWWLFEKVGNSKLPIINYSGGTEIAGGILMGNPLLPIKPCSFPAPCPGMDVDILDEEGKPVGAGKVGELVIKQPWIGMARGFWQEKERYLDTYWRRFKDIWVHGDWAMRDADGHWFILGRSDDTLKVAGKRVGPAEVESLLVAHPLVTEAAVIGIPDETKGTAMVAICVLSANAWGSVNSVSSVNSVVSSDGQEGTTEFTESTENKELNKIELAAELKTLVARDMGKPLAPSKIHFVSALPKTRNAKVMRRVIRSAYLGEDPGDLSALENPQAVEEIKAVGD